MLLFFYDIIMKFIIITLLIILTTFCSYSQNPDSIVNVIDIKVADINSSLDSYRQVIKNIKGDSGEGAYLEGYFQKKQLVKVKMIWFSATHQFHTEYYLSGKNVIFVKDTDYVYKNPISPDTSFDNTYQIGSIKDITDSKKIVNLYYFDKFKIIRWIEKGRIVTDSSDSSDLIELQTFIQLKDFRKYLKMKPKIIKLKR